VRSEVLIEAVLNVLFNSAVNNYEHIELIYESVIMKQWCNDTALGKTKTLSNKHDPVPLCTLTNLTETGLGSNPGLHSEGSC
jgi:hypothetical protein